MKSLFAAVVAVLLMNASGFCQYKLEYKASGPTPLHYKSHTSFETTRSMMGQSSKISVISDQLISMTSKDSGHNLVYTIRIDSSQNLAVMPNGDTAKSVSPALGKVRETLVRPDGEEISSKWLDTTFAATRAGETKDYGSFFFRLPAKKVDLGSTWNQTKVDTVGTPGAEGSIVVNTNTGYKFMDREKFDGIPCVRIDFTGKVDMNGQTASQGMMVGIKGSGTIKGSALFDYSNGRVLKLSGSSTQDITMSSSGNHPMTVPVNQESHYDLYLVK